ncbi:protein kinase-like domain, Phloem protein 2-like protein [Artemisia annua]|uniref:non-specific serine/threonine protein kinase n=1 Tax=Artemisia annua TaxID=35608 RepID=A0A2U1LWY2_ARTAN|nr:protein kinase-like domain, Phloem protein 2-like protein [Artemisia annua]
MSSVNHDDFAHLKIPLADVLTATDNFNDKRATYTSEFEKRYWGELLWSGELIKISARRWLNEERDDEKEQQFWMEISMVSTLKHKNLVSLVGFCDENGEKIIIFRDDTTASLSEYLSDPMELTWVPRLEISVGVAHALSYIHYDEPRDFSVIHRKITSSTILLNNEWEPKLSGFERSMKIKASKRHHSFNNGACTLTTGYNDSTFMETNTVNHKSDVYSFGIVLFELLCGRESVIDSDSNKYLAPLAITHYKEKRLNEIIDWDLRKQMGSQSFDIFAETTYDCLKEERSQRPNIDEIVTRLEKALEIQLEHQNAIRKEFAHLRVPLQNILSATNNFALQNVIRETRFDKSYKGDLLWSGELIYIIARRFKKERKEAEQEFWTEISMLSSLKHKNVVSLVGFCDEKDEKITIYKAETRGSLSIHLSDPMSLTWVRRLEISVGVAHALSYIHYDEPRDFSVIHRRIHSDIVLLNDDWEPKLSDFECSMKVKASQRHHSFHTNDPMYVKGYGDPTYIETKRVNHKSDIYSFGIVLFELLFGRESISEHPDNKYLATLVFFHYKKEILDEIIDPVLRKQMDPQSFNVFAKIAYDCLNEERSRRPDISEVVTRLESSLKLQMERQNAEHSIVAAKVDDTSSNHEKGSLTSISTHVESHVSKETVSFLKDLSHLKFSAEDLNSATDNFAHENFIKKSKFGKLFKGRLLHSDIDIILKRFNSEYIKDESKKIWTEISMLSSLKHKNLVSLIGFYEDKENKVILYKKEANESLAKYLSDQTLTWMQRLKICVGVAKTLSYIHYDPVRDFSVIHCNVRSSKILLDDKWEPKLSGFELSLKNTVSRRHRLLLTRDIVKNVYLDPKYEKTGGVTHKSDVFSFGVVLFEVLCGRSAILPDEELGDGLLSKLGKPHLEDMIDPHLRKQMDQEALKIFSETAYCCIKEERADRPSIDQVVKGLEKALKLQSMYENPELPRSAVDCTSSNHLRLKNLEHLKIGLNDIEMETEKFADKYFIGSGGYGMVYKAQLEHFDSSNSSSIEGKNKCDLPKKRSMVAIKRINNREGEQGFIAEIEILTSCKHENIISLLGFCDEDRDHMILVYELASKGSLEDYLGNSDKMTNLTWMQRLKICLDIAHGLNYVHNNTDQDKQKIIHRDIKSANILLGDNWKAKIADFGLSKIHPADENASTFNASTIAGTPMYFDPEYKKYGRLNKKSDIYSFGVVLFEVLTGRLAHHFDKGIAPVARHHFEKGTIMEIVDRKIKEETDEHVFSLSKGPNKESLEIFSEIAFRCLAEIQAQRPTIDDVIYELKRALKCQENHTDSLKLSLQDIKLFTNTFNQDNLIGHGDFGNVYKGHTHGNNFIAAKRLGRKSAEGEAEFVTELEILMEYKHENVIGLVGYCDEEDEKIIVYEYASRGSLDQYVSNDSLTWVMRLKICINIAVGLEFLHGTDSCPEMVIHRDISSSNILLLDDWKAKISDFGLSLVCPTNQDVDYVIDNVTGTIGYSDPLYSKTGFLTKESDIFSLGAVLFDILCGKLSSVKLDDEYLYLPFLAKQHYHLEKLDELVFEGIKEQIEPQSFITFARIAYQCIHHRRERRPTANEVVMQLKKALEFQEDYEKWESKLPKDYKEIVQMSKCPEIYSTTKKEDLYNIFSNGILLQEDKVLLSFDGNGERNKMVSATMFSYINSCPHEWKSLQESRFETVVEMFDISKLNIKIQTNAQLLSPNVVYGVYLVFKLSDVRQFSSKPMYVNLKYRNGLESLHAYFATWRHKEWMMIKLYQFLNQNENTVFDFLFESFSSYYCGDGAVYVEGIEFRAIDEVKHEEIGKLKEVQQVLKSNFNVDQVQQLPTNFEEIFKICRNYDELFWLGEVNEKKLLVLSAKAEDYEKWEPKLPKDYKEIVQMSKCPEIYSTTKKEDLYNIFSNGILLQEDKVLLSFDGNGQRNKMVSAAMFSYINGCPHEWKSLQESRFETVVEMSDISKLNIEIKTNAQLLSPNVVYGVYLVFKLSDSRKFSSKPMCVNLKYRKGLESLHAYFATWRDKDWMMIELYQFLNQNEDVVFEFLLESFSSYYCGETAVYVDGIEFRAIDKVKHEEIGKLKEVQQVLKSNFNVDQVNEKKLLVLSAKAVLYKFSNVDLFTSKQLAGSRFQEVIELLPQQVFHLNCMIKSQMLSQDTEYVCYLVFKLSENCQGLHCPVKVRDVLHKENNEAEFVYFITPSPLNINGITRVPKQREDGWMEIQLWKFNSTHEFKDDSLSIDMKFTSHEGTMSGLIICGLEFRPV